VIIPTPVVLADSSKFAARPSLLLCPLSRIHTVITDDGITDRDARMLEAAEIRLIVAQTRAADGKDAVQAE
jgi:DeoR family ulaG and ulaABCDEF operon transcriptional repressor